MKVRPGKGTRITGGIVDRLGETGEMEVEPKGYWKTEEEKELRTWMRLARSQSSSLVPIKLQ